jgi:phosphoribosyl 1,2-cyclic phosphodiesterase
MINLNFMASSSKGNSTQITTEKTDLIIDAGIGVRKFNEYKEPPVFPNPCREGTPDTIFITHGHSDHISGLDVICAQYEGEHPWVYIHEDVYEAKKHKFPRLNEVRVHLIQSYGMKHIIGSDLTVTPFSTKHDSEYSLGFVIKQIPDGPKVGYLTDTGMITPVIKNALQDCDAYFIEADYDEEEIEKNGYYPIDLKERIKSATGHLSSTQAIDFVKNNVNMDKVQKIIFGHLSEHTNSPELLQAKIDEAFPNHKDKFIIAKAKEPTKVVIK